MSGFRDWIKRKSLDYKFRRAGEGHRLNNLEQPEHSQPVSQSSQRHAGTLQSSSVNYASEAARQAALTRVQQNQQARHIPTQEERSKRIIEQKARQQLQEEAAVANKRMKDEFAEQPLQMEATKPTKTKPAADDCENLFFECAELFPGLVLPRDDLMERIETELLSELSGNELIAACLLFRTFNHSRTGEVAKAIELFCTYLSNIKSNPDKLDKYGRIRQGNKVFQQILINLKYTDVVMNAIGFTGKESSDSESYYIFALEKIDDIDMMLDVLKSSEPIKLSLYRDMKLYRTSSAATRGGFVESRLPDSFYEVTAADVRKRHEMMCSKREKEEALMTQKLREQLENVSLRTYKYCTVRTKFPSGILLEGTFEASDQILTVVNFVRSCLSDQNIEFTLVTFLKSNEKLIIESSLKDKTLADKTLTDLRLCPAVLFCFDTGNGLGRSDGIFNDECLMMLADS